ncbi:hypothetical protein N7486_011282 [Penicillium sp. IBT 16267x]|nr:hypothetical protein N7486_011282 [Penicillium sp. IBT 16267x]
MSADPPRRRRSSFSERFQRVFNVDRADQTDKSLGPGTPQTPSRVSARPSDENDSKSAATTAPSVPDDAALSSFNFSSTSHIPSLSTTGSSASVRAVPKDEDSTQQMTTEAKHAAESDKISSSPTGAKGTKRKERRATKRLEVERNEMEKRMLQLEQSQTQLDSGNFDRSSRRLVKKQNGSSERSSSAGSLRLRSSSITRFFTRSRRGSQSGIDSANESDHESARGSADTNLAAPVPPSIPLALEERFGADVSRELATRHGTTLIPASQLASNQLSSRPVSSQHPQKPQRLHHTPLKSDDLRENWKMAEEWQKTQGRESGGGLVQPENIVGGRQSPRVSLYGTDLDQDVFTTTPKNGTKTPKAPNAGSPSAGNATYQSDLPSRNTPPEGIPQDADPSAMRITTAQQLPEFSSSMSEESPSSKTTVDVHSSMPVEKYPMRSRVKSTPQNHQRVYKSSPLAMNPNSPDTPSQSSDVDPSLRTEDLDLPKPLRISKIPQFESNQQSTPVSPSEKAQSQPKRASLNENQESVNGTWPLTGNEVQRENRNSRTDYQERQIPGVSRTSPHAIAPPKHPGRLSLEDHPPKWTLNKNPAENTALNGAQHGSKDPQIHHLSPRRVTDGGTSPPGWNDPDHRRSSISSQASSYNTADEEKLDVPPGRSKRASLPAPEPKEAKPAVPTEVATMKETPRNPTSPRTKPPLASGPLSMLRKTPMQKMKPPRSDDVLAKLFVICCQCKHWHDMPSEVYAKLASPERLSSGSRLSRTFSRRNSGEKSIFSSDPNDSRNIPVARRELPRDISVARRELPRDIPVARREPPRGPSGDGSAAVPSPQQAPVHRHQCCWCAHGMSKTCCHGWTALVQMRERYH